MRVLAVDPGYGRCGIAVVEKESGPTTSLRANREWLICSTCIETPASDDFPARLARVARECERLIAAHTPDALVLEKLYLSKNQRTAMRVAEVRGALIELAARNGLAVHEYAPAEVKLAVAGSGRADKRAMMKMVHALVAVEKEIRHDDEYDAIAIAITHLARAPKRR